MIIRFIILVNILKRAIGGVFKYSLFKLVT